MTRTSKLFLSASLAAMVALGACSSSSDKAKADTGGTAAPTTVAGSDTQTDTTPPPPSGSDSATSDSTGTDTAAGGTELSNPAIKKELSASNPDLWALVNYDYLSWSAFDGYNVLLNVGADATKAVDLCNALSALVYDSKVYKATPDTPIQISVPADASDYTGKPVAKRDNKADTCKAV